MNVSDKGNQLPWLPAFVMWRIHSWSFGHLGLISLALLVSFVITYTASGLMALCIDPAVGDFIVLGGGRRIVRSGELDLFVVHHDTICYEWFFIQAGSGNFDADARHEMILQAVPHGLNSGELTRVSESSGECVVLLAGWPFRTVACTYKEDFSTGGYRTSPKLGGIPVLQASGIGDLERAIALAPQLRGILCESLLLFAPLVIIVQFRITRCRHRDRNGWCRNCGYNLRGCAHADRCPECGKVLEQKF